MLKEALVEAGNLRPSDIDAIAYTKGKATKLCLPLLCVIQLQLKHKIGFNLGAENQQESHVYVCTK